MIFNEIKCHVNTSLGLVGGCIPCISPYVRACPFGLYLSTFTAYLRYKMLLISTCAMNQEINKSRHQKGLCMRFSAS